MLVLVLLALDLGVLNKKAHVIAPGEALRWTVFWIFLACLFGGGVYLMYEHHLLGIGRDFGHHISGEQAAVEYFTAYIVEKSLSVDNLFVMTLIFRYFAVPPLHQHRVLFLGIVGALVFRGIFIGAGLWFINLFTWSIYVFGALLVYSAIKMLFVGEGDFEPDKHPLVKAVRRFYPVTSQYHDHHFFVMENGRRAMTPLCVTLVLIEASDVVFAIDSVPAVFAVTRDPFIAFTSNVFAILGLRSLYFALSAVMHAFRYLKLSLIFVLAFVGVKMMLSQLYHLDTMISLGVIFVLLGAGIVASLLIKAPEESLPPKAEDDGSEAPPAP